MTRLARMHLVAPLPNFSLSGSLLFLCRLHSLSPCSLARPVPCDRQRSAGWGGGRRGWLEENHILNIATDLALASSYSEPKLVDTWIHGSMLVTLKLFFRPFEETLAVETRWFVGKCNV